MDFLIGLVQFILVLVFLILIHEFGHFIAAKLFKVEVEEFGIGFPPRIATLFNWQETKFTLNALPLGGFVRPKGENDPSVPGGLAAASPWVRLVVLFAGPLMNLLLGVVLYTVLFTRVGMPDFSSVQVASVVEGSPAEGAGLMEGDLIREINGVDIEAMEDLREIVSASAGEPVNFLIQRGSEDIEVTIVPEADPETGNGMIGIVMGNPLVEANFLQALPNGFRAVYAHIEALVQLPVRLIQGTASPEEGRLVGFPGMFNIFQEVRQGEPETGLTPFLGILFFVTNITISLGILNLVPFPALDGGRILFTLPEIILRKRIPPQYENVINLVGFGLLLLLLIYVNLADLFAPASLFE